MDELSGRKTRGFTMVEILVVFALFAVLGSVALVVSMDTYRGMTFRSDRDLLVALLERARSQSVNNVCLGASCTDGLPHGVHIGDGAYVLFQGNAYDPADPQNVPFDAMPASAHSASLDIVFARLTGTTTPASVTLIDRTGRTSVISINSAGRIGWTN